MNTDVDFKDQLTNEKLLKRFNNQFELVRYAIQLAENTIRSGREPDVWTDSQNISFMILAEIAANKEEFAAVPDRSEEVPVSRYEKQSEPSWNDEVRALKEDKKERKTSKTGASKSKSKAAK